MIDFSKWEVFVNDDQSRTFLSSEITAGGLTEVWDTELVLLFFFFLKTSSVIRMHPCASRICTVVLNPFVLIALLLFQITKHINIVNNVYRLHNLPEFYEVRFFSRQL